MTLRATVSGSPSELSSALRMPMGHYNGARFKFKDDQIVSADLGVLRQRFAQWASEAKSLIVQELITRLNHALSGIPVGTQGADMRCKSERFDPPQFLLEFITGTLTQKATDNGMQGAQTSLQQAIASFRPNASLPHPLGSPSPHPHVKYNKFPGYLLRKADAWESVLRQARQHFSSIEVNLAGSASQSFPLGIVRTGSHGIPVLCRDNGGTKEYWAPCANDGVLTFDRLENFHKTP